jgi:hypothetical protein
MVTPAQASDVSCQVIQWSALYPVHVAQGGGHIDALLAGDRSS